MYKLATLWLADKQAEQDAADDAELEFEVSDCTMQHHYEAKSLGYFACTQSCLACG